ncbi:hypothetical protein AB0C68_04235 [Streptomyces tendae]|uniref:hypothetical protein n=1 Tax=Streptomyces tendae TaxID=1932 RepID=UPI0033CF11C0
MQQHAENGGDHTTDAAEEPEPYDDEVYDEAYDAGPPSEERGPDVFLDVPQLKVDELNLDVENLRARVSLRAEVLDLLKLNVGADVALDQVHLGISGVEAQAQLKVRLDNVALIINRVLTTLDRNPQILEDLARGVGSAVHDVGGGAGSAVRDVAEGAGTAVRGVAEGAGSAAEDIGGSAGEAAGAVARGADGADAVTARRPAARSGHDTGSERSAGRPRTRDDASAATRPVGRRGVRKRGEPP